MKDRLGAFCLGSAAGFFVARVVEALWYHQDGDAFLMGMAALAAAGLGVAIVFGDE
jgi:hypothetical protein